MIRIICFLLLLIISGQSTLSVHSTKQLSSSSSSSSFNDIIDFRFNTAHIDGITNLINDSLLIISNNYYWLLDQQNPLPLPFNVNGHIKQLYDGFEKIDTIWLDPYNDISPQIYLTPEYGLRVVCKEFDDEPFNDISSFCHLPVDHRWLAALKDLDPNRPIDAATWRNRTKNQDGGFWVFFQGKKMITIDPYEMKLRFTYDIQKWMSINDTLTAAFYDYRKNVYHLFFDNNRYYTWTVNVSYMNSLPMSWDRAFLHGKLSLPMRINRDFFGFPEKDLRPYAQPYYKKNSFDIHTNHIVPDDEFNGDDDDQLPNYNDNRNIENDDEHSDRTNSIQYDFTTHLRRLKIEDVLQSIADLDQYNEEKTLY
ncbi:hypothetical protein HUG17_3000 [Dermatophagoides farinae]|uniref:Uncharacterized protein n=1 Tax=Dermatophagoides farinae TaxID=6954 RepID=A0A9D4NW01_DERFA|nr:hypothetical protein HUG17_3000 [Dermatophagoides farinae]